MKTPSKYQRAVLEALAWLQHRDGTPEPIGYGTHRVKATAQLETASTLKALNGCVRHEWVKARTVDPNGSRLPGANLVWSIQPSGYEALRLAQGETDQPQEEPVDTTTQEPPASQAPWSEAHDDDEQTSADLEELDGGEPQVEDPAEDDNPPVNEGSNQLTLAIGGPKPKSSILKILAKQLKFGTTRQFKNMERIPFSGVLEVTGVAVDTEQNGHVLRTQKAKIAELYFGDDEVDVD